MLTGYQCFPKLEIELMKIGELISSSAHRVIGLLASTCFSPDVQIIILIIILSPIQIFYPSGVVFFSEIWWSEATESYPRERSGFELIGE